MTTHLYPVPQTDEALRLLAGLYARRFQAGTPSSSSSFPERLASWHALERIRAVLGAASSQQSALAELADLFSQVEEEHATRDADILAWQETVGQARALVQEVIHAGGNAQVLLAGETDGFRHLCRQCCQDEHHFQQVRFFDHGARRPLLTAEVRNASRSLYGRCQICKQVLAPEKYVVLVPAGTAKHTKGCACTECNQAGVASLLNLYESEALSHALLLPRLAQIAAPSQHQAKARAFTQCWHEGWYVLFDHPTK